MNDSGAVGLLESVGHLNAVLDELLDRKRSMREALRERLSLAMLHDQVIGTNVIQPADVRMIERRDGPGLVLKTQIEPCVVREFGGKDLDGNGASKPCVTRGVNLSHSPSAEWRDDLIRPKACSRREFHVKI